MKSTATRPECTYIRKFLLNSGPRINLRNEILAYWKLGRKKINLRNAIFLVNLKF